MISDLAGPPQPCLSQPDGRGHHLRMMPGLRAALLLAAAAAASAIPAAGQAAPEDPPAATDTAPQDERPPPSSAPAPEPAGAAKEEPPPAPEAQARPDSGSSLDFDLLGEAKPPPEAADHRKLRLRRKMLTVHQGIGLGLVALQLGTTVVGQLNYSDRFRGPDTGRYRLAHKTLAYSTLGVFAVNGLLALLAPSPNTPRKLDRVMVHRLAMFTAAAGMLAQGVLGIYTRERIGRLDQDRFATAHLVVGYATLAALLTGVGVLVF